MGEGGPGRWDKRVYPWGDNFSEVRCNSSELTLQDATPVGIFLAGASPFGRLDMAGNVWGLSRSLWRKNSLDPVLKYPYDPEAGREDLGSPADVPRVLRGGAFFDFLRCVRRAYRRDPGTLNSRGMCSALQPGTARAMDLTPPSCSVARDLAGLCVRNVIEMEKWMRKTGRWKRYDKSGSYKAVASAQGSTWRGE